MCFNIYTQNIIKADKLKRIRSLRAFQKDSPESYLKEPATTVVFSKQSCCLSFRIKYFLLFLLVLHIHGLFTQWDYKHLEENNTLCSWTVLAVAWALQSWCSALNQGSVTAARWGPGCALRAAPNLQEAHLWARPCSKFYHTLLAFLVLLVLKETLS